MNTTSLTTEQVQTLRGSLKGHHLEAILTLALVTGLRRDELLSLKWQDVNLDAHEITVRSTKTKDHYSVHIPDDVASLLKQHAIRQEEARLTAGLTWANLDLIFPDSHGEPLAPQQLIKKFHEVLEQAELPRISFHNLRQTVAQNLYNTLKKKEREHNDHENA